jgi:hypothetical protein
MAPSSFNGPTLKVDIEARMSAAGRQVLEALKRTRLTVDRIPLVSALRDCNSTNAATAHATKRFMLPVQQHGAGSDTCGHG